jgi:hypothetical protein
MFGKTRNARKTVTESWVYERAKDFSIVFELKLADSCGTGFVMQMVCHPCGAGVIEAYDVAFATCVQPDSVLTRPEMKFVSRI